MADTGGELNPPKKIDTREEKLRVVRERQAEERQRRLEELKKHALEAQQLREQKELERRKRMEELRQKESERRSQVEERKRQIWEAERERREAILRKNQERDARIESKRKNERSNIVFAFGSSTPRMLETSDSNCFWGPRRILSRRKETSLRNLRKDTEEEKSVGKVDQTLAKPKKKDGRKENAEKRATSTANLRLFPTTTPTVPLSRRPSERELEPKKRASSAGGLYRNPGDLMSTSMYEVFHWDSEPAKPRLSLARHPDPSLSRIDDPAVRGTPRTPPPPQPPPNIYRPVGGDSEESSPAGAAAAPHLRIGRRKTDLMPTIPSPREGANSRPGSGARSLSRTPGRAYSMARLDILAQPRVAHASHFSQPLSAPSKSMSRSTNHLVDSKQFQSNALTKTDTSKSMVQLHTKGSPMSFIQPRMTRAQRLRNRAKAIGAASSKSLSPEGGLSSGDTTPSRPGSVLSQCSVTSASTPTPPPRLRNTPRRPRPFSIHVTGVSKDKELGKIQSPSEEKPKAKETKAPKPSVIRQSVTKKQENQKQGKNEESNKVESKIVENKTVETSETVNGDASPEERKAKAEERGSEGSAKVGAGSPDGANEAAVVGQSPGEAREGVPAGKEESSVQPGVEQKEKKEVSPGAEAPNGPVDEDPGKGNVMSRSKITTEEEAKAALAERRRLAREQAEREAEAERLRLEMEAQKEAERLRREEEEQRLAEEEQLRLLEESRRKEEERLMQAIQEAQKREEEEKQRRQQEEMARLEKEEAERKAREEAERQRIEMAERLKREEEERQARRKRVEAIMKRTRNNPASSTNKAESEKGEEDGTEHEKDVPKGKVEVFLHGERVSTDRSLTNGQPAQQESHKEALDNNIINNQDTNHSNGVEITNNSLEKEDCLNSNSNLVTPLIAFQGKTKDTPIAANYMA